MFGEGRVGVDDPASCIGQENTVRKRIERALEQGRSAKKRIRFRPGCRFCDVDALPHPSRCSPPRLTADKRGHETVVGLGSKCASTGGAQRRDRDREQMVLEGAWPRPKAEAGARPLCEGQVWPMVRRVEMRSAATCACLTRMHPALADIKATACGFAARRFRPGNAVVLASALPRRPILEARASRPGLRRNSLRG